MKKIAIFQSDLHVGGIQRSLINLLKFLEKEDIFVDVFLFDDKNIFFPTDFHDNIRIYFREKFPYWNRFLYFDIVRRMWGKRFNDISDVYDVAIDFNSYWNECAVGALHTKARKHVMWIHNDVEIKAKNEYKYRILWHFFKGKLKYYDEFVPVSHGILPSFQKRSRIMDKPYTVIPNCIDAQEIREKMEDNIPEDFLRQLDRNKVNVVSVGRLCHQKGYDLMVEMIQSVIRVRQDIHFYIIGDGPDRSQIESQIARCELGEYITLLGNRSNPFPIMAQMDAFLMMSRYEGQGMVLWEARSVGLPIVISKHLERYTEGISAVMDVEKSLCYLKKCVPKFNCLDEYNGEIIKKFMKLLEEQAD